MSSASAGSWSRRHTASIGSVAPRWASTATWPQVFIVRLIWLWPSTSMSIRGWTPWTISRVARDQGGRYASP
jgi:hypothetical protein